MCEGVIFAKLVPKIIDARPEIFIESNNYKTCSDILANYFLEKVLPVNYESDSELKVIGESTEIIYEKNNVDLSLIYSPSHLLFIEKSGVEKEVWCPEFNLSFDSKNKDFAQKVLLNAFDVFFLRKRSLDGFLYVDEEQDNKIIREGVDLLRFYLPSKTKIFLNDNEFFYHRKWKLVL